MKLGIMQPYFFPYLGYFSLIEYSDEFILFDIPQYDRKGWMHRNRILSPNGKEIQYIRTATKKAPLKTPINQIYLDNQKNWKELILKQVEHYKRKAPFYINCVNLLKSILAYDYQKLVDLNYSSIKEICSYLGIKKPIHIFSEMNLPIKEVNHAGQWALEISKSYGADEYVNPPGGVGIFKKEEFKQASVNLTFLQNNLDEYHQLSNKFYSGLSIIDVLMYNSSEDTRKLIRSYSLAY